MENSNIQKEIFNHSNLKANFEPVDNEGRQGLSINVLGHDDQRTLGLEDNLYQCQENRGRDVCETLNLSVTESSPRF